MERNFYLSSHATNTMTWSTCDLEECFADELQLALLNKKHIALFVERLSKQEAFKFIRLQLLNLGKTLNQQYNKLKRIAFAHNVSIDSEPDNPFRFSLIETTIWTTDTANTAKQQLLLLIYFNICTIREIAQFKKLQCLARLCSFRAAAKFFSRPREILIDFKLVFNEVCRTFTTAD